MRSLRTHHPFPSGPGALPESLQRVQRIAQTPIAFQELDITDGAALRELFSTVRPLPPLPPRALNTPGRGPSCYSPNASLLPQHRFSAVMHFAGLKAVGESVRRPLEYYNVNLTGTIRLLEVSGNGSGAAAQCSAVGHDVVLCGGLCSASLYS